MLRSCPLLRSISMLSSKVGRIILLVSLLLVTVGQQLGAFAMPIDEDELCRQISICARKEFIHQYQTNRLGYKLKPNTAYHSEVCFNSRPDGTITNVRLRLASAEQLFDSLTLKTICNAQFPDPKAEKDIPISVTFSVDSENVDDVQTETKIRTRSPKKLQPG